MKVAQVVLMNSEKSNEEHRVGTKGAHGLKSRRLLSRFLFICSLITVLLVCPSKSTFFTHLFISNLDKTMF